MTDKENDATNFSTCKLYSVLNFFSNNSGMLGSADRSAVLLKLQSVASWKTFLVILVTSLVTVFSLRYYS